MDVLTDSAWLEVLRSNASGRLERVNGRPLPPMPDATLQINTVGQAGAGAMEEAWGFTAECLNRFRRSPLFRDSQKVLLDFGTGWGRIARCFLRDIAAENIVGADVSAELIAGCKATFPGPRFIKCNAMPPIGLADRSVDFIVGYSVFSHLSEAACLAWMAEFARILKPGGMAALTTRGRWFFDYAASLKGADPYSRALSQMFPDPLAAKARYDLGYFVHSNADGVSGGGALNRSFYGETFIPERYARDSLGNILPLYEFYAPEGHPILFFQKVSERS